MLMHDFVIRNARRFPNRTALVCRAENVRYTWKEYNARVNKLANGLASLGVKKDDRVGVVMGRNCHRIMEMYFACAKLGAATLPVNPRLHPKEIAYILNDGEPVVLCVDVNMVDSIAPIKESLKSVKTFIGIGDSHPYEEDYEDLVARSDDTEPQVDVKEDDTFLLLYTSGTTGNPKGVMLTHKNEVTEHTNQLAVDRDVKMCDVVAAHCPLFHIAPVAFWDFHLFFGATLVISTFNGSDPEAFLKDIVDEKSNSAFLIPSMWKVVLAHPNIGKYDLSCVHVAGYGGAPMPSALVEEAMKRMPKAKWVGHFGQTETGPDIAYVWPKDHYPGSKYLDSVGHEPWLTETKIVDDDDNELPPGKIGEICARGDNIMKGYWKMPEETAETLRGGWCHTGDLGYKDEEGYLWLTDRKKDIIISGGENISSVQVESVISKLPGILDVAVIGVPDEKWGETPKAIVSLRPGAELTEEQIIEHCKKNLASFKKPTSVEFTENLPKTASGKVRKNELREKYWKGYEKRIQG